MALVVNELGAGPPETIAGRYRIEARIAKGGMGAVYRAFDTVRNRPVALKRLHADGDSRRRTRMFEREFYTLLGLKHPRIIEVFDYGIDPRGAYYTMELLDGRDLRDLAPLPYKTACLYLRDVASSLALLHSRHLLHRDLSPRNVRITSSGRAKLIDFGALASFGHSGTLVGTPPFVPPEGLDGGLLDQRSDLYALGALGYWVLTGTHAYDVHAMDELRAAWREPLPPPSARAAKTAGLPPIPAELDRLIVALLSHNPLARPASAADVIARLTTIAGLAPDEEPLSVLSYLRGGKTVGRARERAQLRKRSKAALAGRGSVVMVEAEAGIGATRIFSDLATEARLAGAAAVVVEAGVRRGAYAVADEIARGLLATQPDKARAALGDDEALLNRFLSLASSRSSSQRLANVMGERTSADPRESRLRIQAALLASLERLARAVPLVIAVRDLQRADESSVALLSALAHGIGSKRVLLALAYDPNEPIEESASHASLRASALHLRLHGLGREEVHALLATTFGEVQHSERLAAWLHGLTSGNPQACRDLLHHLIETGVIRFSEGVWALPQELSSHDLPQDLGQALRARIARLDGEERRLALALAVERGAIPRERVLQLARLERIAEPLRVLSDLEQRGVLVTHDESIQFAHGSLRDALLGLLSPQDRRRLHAQLGALLAQHDPDDVSAMLDAGWHLLHGGQEARGADLLADAGVALSADGDGLPDAIPALRAALEVFRKQGRSQRELARLLAPLAISGFFADRKVLESYGEEAATILERVLGLHWIKRLRPLLGPSLGTLAGLGIGWLGYAFGYGPRKATRALVESVQLFAELVLLLTGLGTITLDAPRARRYADLLEPLAGLGEDHAAAVTYELVSALAMLPEDRVAETLRRLRRVEARFEAPNKIVGLEHGAKLMLQAGALYAIGALEGFKENPEVLQIARRLDGFGLKLCELFASQIRASYFGVLGELELAEREYQKVEVLAIQAGSGWQVELWAPCSQMLACLRTGDLVAMRRIHGQLERLAREVPSLRRHVQFALAGCLQLRGDRAAAQATGVAVLTAAEPRAFIGWSAATGAQIEDFVALGDAERGRALGLRALSLFDAEDRAVSVMVAPIVAQVAWAEAVLGESATGAARIEAYLAELGARAGRTTRGVLHETAARIAHRAGDLAQAHRHLAEVERTFGASDHPSLVARVARLQVELGVRRATGAAHDTLDFGLPTVEHALGLLRRADGPQQRFERALELLLEHSGAPAGFAFRFDDGEITLVAPRDEGDAPPACRARVLSALEQHIGEADSSSTAAGSDANSEDAATRVEREDRYRVFVLRARRDDAELVVGAIAVAVGRRPLRALPAGLLAAMGEALAEPASESTSR